MAAVLEQAKQEQDVALESECKEDAPDSPVAKLDTLQDAAMEISEQDAAPNHPQESSKTHEETEDIDMAAREGLGVGSEAAVEETLDGAKTVPTEVVCDDAPAVSTVDLESRDDSRMEAADLQVSIDQPEEANRESQVVDEAAESSRVDATELDRKDDATSGPTAHLEAQTAEALQISAEETSEADGRDEVAQSAQGDEENQAKVGEAELQAEAQVVKAQGASGEPQKPRKPGNGYMLFSTSIREEVVAKAEAESGVKPKMGEVGKLISARWTLVSEEDKAGWKEKAVADKQRYEVEMKTYAELLDPVGTLRAKCEHLIPKKPASYFGLFIDDATNRGKAAGLLTVEGKEPTKPNMMAKLGAMWRSATDEEKAPFFEQNKKEQLEFDEKQRAWQASPECTELGRAVIMEQEARENAERLEREASEKKIADRNAKESQRRETQKERRSKDSTPSKRPSEDAVGSSPEAKKPRATAAKAKTPAKETGPSLDEGVLMEATKLGWETAFRNLASRGEVIASGKSAGAVLDSLRSSGGLVNPAKRALLGC